MKPIKYSNLINFLYQSERSVAISVKFDKDSEDIVAEFGDFLNLIGMGNNTYKIQKMEDIEDYNYFDVTIYVNNLIHKVMFTYEDFNK